MRHCSILPGLGGLGGLGCLLSSGTSGRASLAAEARTNEAIIGLTIAVLILGLGLVVTSGLGATLVAQSSAKHIVIDDPESLPELPLELGADLPEDVLELWLLELVGEMLDGLNVVVGANALILGVGCRKDLEQGSRNVAQDLETRAWVGIYVPLPEKLKQRNSNRCGLADPVPDRDPLEGWRQSILPSKEKTGELGPDLLGVVDAAHANLVSDSGVLADPSDVLNIRNWQLGVNEQTKGDLDVLQGTNLPLFWGQLWKPGQALDDEVVLEANVLVIAGQLGVDDGLGLELSVEAAMILLQGNHTVLQDTSCLAGLAVATILVQRNGTKEIDSAVEEMDDVLEAGIRCQMNSVSLKRGSWKTRHQKEVGRLHLHDLGELLQDLWHGVAVPARGGPVHRGAQEEHSVRPFKTGSSDRLETLLQDRLNMDTNGSRDTE